MAKILVTRLYPENGLELLRQEGHELTIWSHRDPMKPEELIRQCQHHAGILCTGTERIHADFLDHVPSLKMVSQFAVGYDNIDIDACQRRGITVSNTPGAMSAATADIAFGLMIASARRMFHWSRWIGTGAWGAFEPRAQLGLELTGKTLGIVGMGRIGMEMARRCQGAYEMQIFYHNRNAHQEAELELQAIRLPFEELLRKCDVVSVHTPLTSETKYLFDHKAFAIMKETAIFINTARGAVHHEGDLIKALQNDEIWAAGLDVMDPEPMKPDNPLLSMENACVIPHLGSATFSARAKMSEMAAKNLISYFKTGRAINQLTT